jgi:hypothetical protein
LPWDYLARLKERFVYSLPIGHSRQARLGAENLRRTSECARCPLIEHEHTRRQRSQQLGVLRHE